MFLSMTYHMDYFICVVRTSAKPQLNQNQYQQHRPNPTTTMTLNINTSATSATSNPNITIIYVYRPFSSLFPDGICTCVYIHFLTLHCDNIFLFFQHLIKCNVCVYV